jgi:hypothetical protein
MGINRVITALFLLMCGFCQSSCDIINPDEPIPARIKIEPFDLQVNPGQGSDRHKITDVWVAHDQNFLGVFSPPVEIPFLTDGNVTSFTFHPGIRNNGITDDPIIYPMYTDYVIDLTLAPGSFTTVNPVTRYKTGVTFSLNADFETGNDFVDNRDTFPSTVVTRSMTDVFEGEYSGEIVLTREAPHIIVGNALAMILPTDGTPCYLEFQYKSEMEMSIGILGISITGVEASNFFYLVKPSENWNMLYVELTDRLQESGFSGYKILFQSLYPSNSTKTELRIFLDNVKVVHL